MTGTSDPTPKVSPLVALSDGALHVVDWMTRVPQIVQFFEQMAIAGKGSQFGTILEQALTAGVVSIQAGGVSINVDYIQKEFERLRNQLKSDLDGASATLTQVTESTFSQEGGTLVRALEKYLGEGGRLADLFDPQRKDSALGRIQEILAEHFDGEGSRLGQLLDLTNQRSPLHKWKETIDNGFKELRKLIEDYRASAESRLAADLARAEEREKGTQKGLDYQAVVFDAVNEIAKVFGDVAELVADASGIGGSKVGDIAVSVNTRETGQPSARIVLEAKDRTIGITPMRRELEEAKANRAALIAIGVYSRSEYMPTGSAPFREESPTLYLCLFDKDNTEEKLALTVAYRIARVSALQMMRRECAPVDAAAIREDVREASTLLSAFTTIKRHLTHLRSSMGKGFDGLEGQIEDLRLKLSDVLDRIDRRTRVEDSARTAA